MDHEQAKGAADKTKAAVKDQAMSAGRNVLRQARRQLPCLRLWLRA